MVGEFEEAAVDLSAWQMQLSKRLLPRDYTTPRVDRKQRVAVGWDERKRKKKTEKSFTLHAQLDTHQGYTYSGQHYSLLYSSYFFMATMENLFRGCIRDYNFD